MGDSSEAVKQTFACPNCEEQIPVPDVKEASNVCLKCGFPISCVGAILPDKEKIEDSPARVTEQPGVVEYAVVIFVLAGLFWFFWSALPELPNWALTLMQCGLPVLFFPVALGMLYLVRKECAAYWKKTVSDRSSPLWRALNALYLTAGGLVWGFLLILGGLATLYVSQYWIPSYKVRYEGDVTSFAATAMKNPELFRDQRIVVIGAVSSLREGYNPDTTFPGESSRWYEVELQYSFGGNLPCRLPKNTRNDAGFKKLALGKTARIRGFFRSSLRLYEAEIMD